jgi:hypothetical protein
MIKISLTWDYYRFDINKLNENFVSFGCGLFFLSYLDNFAQKKIWDKEHFVYITNEFIKTCFILLRQCGRKENEYKITVFFKIERKKSEVIFSEALEKKMKRLFVWNLIMLIRYASLNHIFSHIYWLRGLQNKSF